MDVLNARSLSDIDVTGTVIATVALERNLPMTEAAGTAGKQGRGA